MEKLIIDILENSGKEFSDQNAIEWLNKKDIESRTYKEMLDNVKCLRKGLKSEGFSKKNIALIGTSSPLWVESYLSIITGDNAAVPLDALLSADSIAELINRSDAEALFISNKLVSSIDYYLKNCAKLKKIYILTEDEIDKTDDKISSYTELMKKGENSTQDANRPLSTDLATIIFTSGTTGISKGVMLSQRNLSTNVESVIIEAKPGTKMLSVLPIHHAFCLVMDWLKGFSLGATLCVNDSFMHMVRNMGIFKPDCMLMVPMMIEMIYNRLKGADPAIPKKAIADNVFGGNLTMIFTGGAHLDPFYVTEFAEYGINVLEGYGMSECSPVISSNNPNEYKVGSIGKPLPNVEVKFDNGEILVKGSSVMMGYYKMPEETAKTLEDGWLRTGDKGYIDEDGYLFINGRVKNLIILSNGENISPEELETKIALMPLVGEVIVTGEDNGLTARIYPDQLAIETLKLSEELVESKIKADIKEYNLTQPTYRQIVNTVIRKNPFIRNTTKKIKRDMVLIDEPIN